MVSSLSQSDKDLLTAYIVHRFNLVELALYAKHQLLDLQDWALQPHIRAHVRRHLFLQKLQHETETADARSEGIAALRDILQTTKDPIERRRAAQTLIRVGSPTPERTPRAPAAHAAQPERAGLATPRTRGPSNARVFTDDPSRNNQLDDADDTADLEMDELDEDLDNGDDLDDDITDLPADAEPKLRHLASAQPSPLIPAPSPDAQPHALNGSAHQSGP